MKRNGLWWMVTAVLCLTLAGCAPKTAQVTPAPSPSATSEPTSTPTPTPTPSPEPTPTPAPWEKEPREYIMGWLDELLDVDEICLNFWIHPGSGPTPTKWPAAECCTAIREMFEDLDWDNAKLLTWEEQDAEDDSWVNMPGAYGVSLHGEDWWQGDEGYFSLNLNCRVIRVNWGDDQLYFLVPGAEELCTKLTDLEPSVYVNMGRTRVPAQGSKEATLKLYLETALERTRELGHITDYELRDYAVTPPEEGSTQEEEVEHPGFGYTATYAFKPTHPESAFWEDYDLDSTNGWVVANIEEHTEGLIYDERDGCYGMY